MKNVHDKDTQAILARREAFIKQMLSDEEMEQIQGGVKTINVALKPCLTIISDPKPCLTILPPNAKICLSPALSDDVEID